MHREVKYILRELEGLTLEKLNEVVSNGNSTSLIDAESVLSLKQAVKVYEWYQETHSTKNINTNKQKNKGKNQKQQEDNTDILITEWYKREPNMVEVPTQSKKETTRQRKKDSAPQKKKAHPLRDLRRALKKELEERQKEQKKVRKAIPKLKEALGKAPKKSKSTQRILDTFASKSAPKGAAANRARVARLNGSNYKSDRNFHQPHLVFIPAGGQNKRY